MIWIQNGYCGDCGYQCAHANIEWDYTRVPNGDGTHSDYGYCIDCDADIVITEECVLSGGSSGYCTVCDEYYSKSN